jgi:hypothetical protein
MAHRSKPQKPEPLQIPAIDAESEVVLTLAIRLRASILAAKMGTSYEEELAFLQRDGWTCPQERELFLSLAVDLLTAVELCGGNTVN